MKPLNRSSVLATMAAAGLVLSGVGAASAAPAASARASGTESFLIAQINNRQSVVAHGLFTAGGTDVSTDAKDVLHLAGGTFSVFHPDKDGKFKSKIDRKTCFATFTGSGKYTLGGGTGKYKGISGHGTYKLYEQGVLKRTKSGACNTTANATVSVGYVQASGPVTLP